MSKEQEFRKILDEIEENHRKLSECPRHHFIIKIEYRYNRWKCSECGGEIEGTNKLWYERGLKHGYKDNF